MAVDHVEIHAALRDKFIQLKKDNMSLEIVFNEFKKKNQFNDSQNLQNNLEQYQKKLKSIYINLSNYYNHLKTLEQSTFKDLNKNLLKVNQDKVKIMSAIYESGVVMPGSIISITILVLIVAAIIGFSTLGPLGPIAASMAIGAAILFIPTALLEYNRPRNQNHENYNLLWPILGTILRTGMILASLALGGLILHASLNPVLYIAIAIYLSPNVFFPLIVHIANFLHTIVGTSKSSYCKKIMNQVNDEIKKIDGFMAACAINKSEDCAINVSSQSMFNSSQNQAEKAGTSFILMKGVN